MGFCFIRSPIELFWTCSGLIRSSRSRFYGCETMCPSTYGRVLGLRVQEAKLGVRVWI